MIRKLKSLVQGWCAAASNWVSDHIFTEDTEIRWQDHLRWWLEARINWVFSIAYNGSDEEREAVYRSELPLKYFSDRQRAILTLPRQHYGAHCVHCFFDGYLDQCVGDRCPDCGEAVYLDEFDPSEPRPVRWLLIPMKGGAR